MIHTPALTAFLALAALHIPSWAYVGRYGYVPPPAIAQRYLSFAEDDGNGEGAVEAVCPPRQSACTPVHYVDPGILYVPNDPACRRGAQVEALASGEPDAFLLHRSDAPSIRLSFRSADPRFFCGRGAEAFFPRVGTPRYARWWRDYAQAHFTQPNTALFVDDLPFDFYDHLYKARVSRAAEIADDRGWNREVAGFEQALAPRPIFVNALGPGGGYLTERDWSAALGAFAASAPANVRGYIAENVLYNAETHVIAIQNAAPLLDLASEILASAHAAVIVMDEGDGHRGTPFEERLRRTHTALVWLIATGDRVVDWEDISGRSRSELAFYPEELVVPAEPASSMRPFRYGGMGNASGCGAGSQRDRGGAADLRVACGTIGHGVPAGVYRREFASCSYAGTPFGACAVVLNATDQPRVASPAWFRGRFRHQLTWSGGAFSEIGCPSCDGKLALADVAFDLGRSTVPPHDAVLLTP